MEASEPEVCTQFDTNVDDMDPRLWPGAIEQVMDAGALDAWVTPIVMKKGRPAFCFSALCHEEAVQAVKAAIFQETTTIGIRETTVRRHVLARQQSTIEMKGQTIGVKTAYGMSANNDGPVNQSIEWDDVAAAAKALGLSAKEVLRAASVHAASSEESLNGDPNVG